MKSIAKFLDILAKLFFLCIKTNIDNRSSFLLINLKCRCFTYYTFKRAHYANNLFSSPNSSGDNFNETNSRLSNMSYKQKGYSHKSSYSRTRIIIWLFSYDPRKENEQVNLQPARSFFSNFNMIWTIKRNHHL